MKKLVKTISVMLAVALSAALFIVIPAKVDAAPATQIYVNGVAMYDSTEHMWRDLAIAKYDQKTNTLYLHGNMNYQYTGGSYNHILCGVLVEGDINLVVDGPSLIHLGNSGLVGVSVTGNCNMTLKNKLTINGGGGINVGGKLTVNGKTNGKLVIKKTGGHLYGGITAKSIVMKNVGGVNIVSPTLFGMHSTGGNVYIKNCKMKVTGHTGAIAAFYGKVTITGKNSITATATAKGAPAIGVVLNNKTNYIGCPVGKGKGKIVLGKKVKITSPQAVKKKGKAVTKTWAIVKGSTNKITMKVLGLSNGKICSKVTIK